MVKKCTGKMLKEFLKGTYDPAEKSCARFDFRTVGDAESVEIDGNQVKIDGVSEATNVNTVEGSLEQHYVKWLKENPTTYVVLSVPWDKETAVRLAVANVLLG